MRLKFWRDPFELGLILLGLFLVTGSGYVYFFYSEKIPEWLGWTEVSQMEKVGQVSLKKRDVKRKYNQQSEFLGIDQQSSLFNRDTIVTGGDSFVVITLDSGGEIEISQNSLIQLLFQEEATAFGVKRSIVLDVQKGDVKGSVGDVPIVVKKANEVVSLEKPKVSIREQLTKATTTEPEGVLEKPKPFECQVVQPLEEKVVQLSKISNDGSYRQKFVVNCERGGDFSPISLLVLNSADQVIAQGQLKREQDNRFGGEVLLKNPGTLRFKVSDGKKESETFVFRVSEKVSGMEWIAGKMNCDFSLRFRTTIQAPAESPVKVYLSGETAMGIGLNETLNVNLGQARVTLPKEDRFFEREWFMGLELQHPLGWKVESDLYRQRSIPLCAKLAEPKDQKKQKGDRVYFSWALDDRIDKYRFELSRSPDFANVQKVETPENFVIRFGMSPGVYFWRVWSFAKGKTEVSLPRSVVIE